jgi:hypothetical protein
MDVGCYPTLMRNSYGIALAAMAIGAFAACATTSPDEAAPATSDSELIACGFIECPRGMRCEARRDGGAPDGAIDDATPRTYGECVPDPCSLLRCPIANTRCVEVTDDGAVRGQCVVSPCTMIHCLAGTKCVERASASGLPTARCERDPCAFINCIGGMHCEPREVEAGLMGICVR